jgi:hypothetical protein
VGELEILRKYLAVALEVVKFYVVLTVLLLQFETNFNGGSFICIIRAANGSRLTSLKVASQHLNKLKINQKLLH